MALWNGKDPILKERLFGLTNSEGNHGEDVMRRAVAALHTMTARRATALRAGLIGAFGLSS